MNGYLLDTHVWIWVQQFDTQQFSAEFPDEVEDWQRRGQLYLSDISVWEIARLVADGHLDLGMSVDSFVVSAMAQSGFQLKPLTPNILIESTRLPGELHRDPADRMLVATAREHGLTLVTRDKLLLQYGRKGYLRVRKP